MGGDPRGGLAYNSDSGGFFGVANLVRRQGLEKRIEVL
jgi:hypothetical protein